MFDGMTRRACVWDGMGRRSLADQPLGTSPQAAIAALLCYLLTFAVLLLPPLQSDVNKLKSDVQRIKVGAFVSGEAARLDGT